MANKNTKDGGDHSAREGITPNDKKHTIPTKYEIILRVLELAGTVLLFAFATACFESGLHKWGDLCLFLASACAFTLIADFCRKAQLLYVNLGLILSICVSGVLFLILALKSKPSSETSGIAQRETGPSQNLSEIANSQSPSPINASPTPAATRQVSELTPMQIIAEIRTARPILQDDIAQSFIGAHVRWLLALFSINKDSDGSIAAIFDDGSKGGATSMTTVSFYLSDDETNQLRLAQKGSLFYATGTILHIYGDLILLKDTTMEPYTEPAK